MSTKNVADNIFFETLALNTHLRSNQPTQHKKDITSTNHHQPNLQLVPITIGIRNIMQLTNYLHLS